MKPFAFMHRLTVVEEVMGLNGPRNVAKIVCGWKRQRWKPLPLSLVWLAEIKTALLVSPHGFSKLSHPLKIDAFLVAF